MAAFWSLSSRVPAAPSPCQLGRNLAGRDALLSPVTCLLPAGRRGLCQDREGATVAGETYDYVIAGGGSAACVAAMRLVREAGARVLVLERGPERVARVIDFPAGYLKYLARED